MLVAPPGSMKTELVEGLRDLPNTHLIDAVTPNTFLSGQIVDGPQPVSPSLLHRIGQDGLVIIPDFGTVLAMRAENRAAVLADLRRIFDGNLRKEYGTTEKLREWVGRLTVVVATTPEVDRVYTIFQTLGERFIMVRWKSPRGVDAALIAMNQDRAQARADVTGAVRALFAGLQPGDVTISSDLQRRIAALTEIVVKARTHVARNERKEMIYVPEPEGATRLAQKLCQLAKGSARLDQRPAVNEADLSVVRRSAFDCIPSVRRQILTAMMDDDVNGLDLPRKTREYACEDLEALGLLAERSNGYVLSKSTQSLVQMAQL